MDKKFAVIMLVLVLILGLVLVVGPFTGFFGAGQLENVEQRLDVQLESDARLELSLNIPEESFQLVSFKVSGDVEGAGSVKIYLNSSAGKYLVFDSSRLREGSGEIISGRAVEGADEEDSAEVVEAKAEEEPEEEPEEEVEEEVEEPEEEPVEEPEEADTEETVEESDKVVEETTEEGSEGIDSEEAEAVEEEEATEESEEETETETESNESVEDIEVESNESDPAEVAEESVEEVVEEEVVEAVELEPEVVERGLTSFSNVCLETCLISDVFNESEYELLVEIGEESGVKIDSVEYSYSVSAEENESLGKLNLIDSIPIVRVSYGGIAQLDLGRYFERAERYELIISNISAEFEGDIATLRPDEGFKGARLGKVIAYAGNESIESNEFNVLVSSGQIKIDTSRGKIKVGEKVKWTKNISLEVPEDVTIELPEEADNVSVKKKEGEVEKEAVVSVNRITGAVVYASGREERFSLLEWLKAPRFTGFAVEEVVTNVGNSSEEKVEVILQDNATEYTIEYETDAPQAVESEIASGKRVVISGPDDLNYTDVLSFSTIPEVLEVGQEDVIKIYWEENNSYVPFEAYDLSGNGLLDYVEWITPHLSNQTFDIILITQAEHLDGNRTFIEDVFDLVESRDGNWTEPIPDGHYVRVTFERNLTSNKDITIYARSSENGRVEVYEKDRIVKIADFGVISEDKKYRILLTSLVGEQDTFDLKVVNGAVEFDHIIDPNSAPSVSNVNLASSSGTNLTGENLTVTFDVSDADNDSVKNITNWYKDGTSVTILNMPFEGGSNGIFTKDYSGFSNNGTVSGATWNSSGGYDGFGAYEFDGINDVITLGDVETLSNDTYSISLWFNADYISASNSRQEMVWGAVSGISDERFRLEVRNDYINFHDDYLMDITAAWQELVQDRWYHIVAVYDYPNQNASVYLDGVLKKSDTSFNQASNGLGVLNMGRRSSSNSYFNGTIDDVDIYNYALSPEQIVALYKNRTDLIVSQETAVGDVWSAEVTPNDGTVDGATVQSNNLTIYSVPNVTLNAPENNSNFEVGVFNITLNATVTDADGDTMCVEIFGDNSSTPSAESLLYKECSVANNTEITYNWTSPVINSIYADTTDLVGLWHFDNRSEYGENGTLIYDFSSTGNNGTCAGTSCPVYDTSQKKIGASAMNFDGNDYLDLGGSSNLQMTGSMTISTWVRPTTIGSNNRWIITKGGYSGNRGWILRINKDISPFNFSFDISGDGTSITTRFSDMTPTTNQWYHVVGVYDASAQTMDMYVNGVLSNGQLSGTVPSSIKDASKEPRIGRRDDNNEFWIGQIDETAVWNRSLSASEILDLYRLRAGTYRWYVNVSDDTNETQSEIRQFTITASDATVPNVTSLTEDPSDPATYSSGAIYEFNATVVDDVAIDSVLIEFDGVNYTVGNVSSVFNFTISDLSAGTHNYYWRVNDTSNNLNITALQSYTINNATGDITLLINGSAANQTAVFGTQTNTSTSTLYGSTTLLRDGVNVDSSNAVFVTLGVGDYTYNATSSGDQNHSSASIERFVHITQAASEVNLTLNGTESNITIDEGDSILLNGTLITGDSGTTIRLYNNGTLINEGTGEVSNSTTFNDISLMNITVIYIGSQNYSISSETYYVDVQDATAPSINLTYPLAVTYTSGRTEINYTVSDNLALNSCWYSTDSGVTNTSVTCGSNVSSLSSSEGSNTWIVYANDTSGNENSSSITFTVSTPSSGGGSSGGSSGGGGGGSSIVTSSEKGLNLDVVGLESLGFRRDMEKNVTVAVTSNHFKFLNNCTAKVTGLLEDWFSNDEVKGISRGERVEYIMKLKVPVSISFGDYTSDFVLSCDEGSRSEEFNLTVYENGLYGEILNYEKGAGNKLSVSYGMQEFDGVDREVKIIYKIVDLEGIVILEGSEENFLSGEERKELSFEVELPKSAFGEFDLIMEFNDGNFVKSVKKRIFLPSTGGITGLALSEEQKKVLSVIGVILFAIFMLFLVIKFIYKHNKRVRVHHRSKRRLIELEL